MNYLETCLGYLKRVLNANLVLFAFSLETLMLTFLQFISDFSDSPDSCRPSGIKSRTLLRLLPFLPVSMPSWKHRKTLFYPP